jgi:hypothetical protein
MSILSDKPNKQKAVLKEVTAIAKGTIPHIKPTVYKKEELKELSEAYENAKKKAKNSNKIGDICKAIFTTANYRDAIYTTRGRKYMRTAGLNGKSRAAWGRLESLDWMER